ncbi:AI-2E family transporter [Pontibacter cellulosilyticus]|uniref:AI-2E family transporter n=1 Tax=Pontibacter cellulosilyticus TaxID=1720253 RepID=A0A923SHG5_9BACT|nr:AI-2E family transporter [Pontibacter cellulosilyticus]MBC5991522.1 AI-2E family transporter [Pontibacter cellulosilyticus]
MENKYSTHKEITIWLLFGILLVYVLVAAREFLYPIFIAILFAYLLYPVESRLEKWGLPRLLANFITVILAMAFFVGIIVLLYHQLSVFIGDFPTMQENVLSNLDRLQHALDKKLGDKSPRNEHWLRQQVVSGLELSGSFLKELLSATTNTLVKFGLMPVYVFLALYYRNKIESFIYRLTPSSGHSKARRIIEDVSTVTKHYMAGVVSVILILCVINSTGLLLIGVQYAILLGILSAFMNFIPYFGTLIGGAIPLLYTFVVQGDLNKTLAVLGFFLVVQFTENNILTPNITGNKVNINPMFTILSIIVGGMIWGLPGMFVAVPYLGMFKIYCDHTPELKPWSFMLGTEGTEEHALTIGKIKTALGLGKK